MKGLALLQKLFKVKPQRGASQVRWPASADHKGERDDLKSLPRPPNRSALHRWLSPAPRARGGSVFALHLCLQSPCSSL